MDQSRNGTTIKHPLFQVQELHPRLGHLWNLVRVVLPTIKDHNITQSHGSLPQICSSSTNLLELGIPMLITGIMWYVILDCDRYDPFNSRFWLGFVRSSRQRYCCFRGYFL